ncbi:hypothetical protein ACLKA6_014288 [Drosophila palustris]
MMLAIVMIMMMRRMMMMMRILTLTVITTDVNHQMLSERSPGMCCSLSVRLSSISPSYSCSFGREAFKQNAGRGSNAETCTEMVALHLARDHDERCNVQPAMAMAKHVDPKEGKTRLAVAVCHMPCTRC